MTLPASALPLAVSGGHLTGADGKPHSLGLGVNWGGAQQDEMLPYGLDRLHRSVIIDRIVSWGMSHVRFLFSLGSFVRNNGTPSAGAAKASRLSANPDLQGLTPWGVFQVLVDDMTAAGLYCILNQHLLYPGWCCSTQDGNGLWYNDNWPASTFTSTWLMIAERFAGNNLVGYDLHNEPRPATIGGVTRTPSWGAGWSGPYPTDFRDIYQRTANAILARHPGALIFCEGLSYASDLTGWKAHPVTGPGIVASLHDYPWFHSGPASLTAYYDAMDARAGYLVQQQIAPVWVGEFGTGTDGPTASLESGWLPEFISWASSRPLAGACWWELSATGVLGTEPVVNVVKAAPGGREGFGLMSGQDWLGSQVDVLAMLKPLM